MQVDSLITVKFTEAELKESLLISLECEMNSLIVGTPEHTRRKKIINHIKNETHVIMEWVDDVFYLSPDGIVMTEEF